MSFTAIRCKLWAEIDGEEVDLISVQCAFEMNKIPVAQAVLPVGREVRTLNETSAHEITANAALQAPVQIWGEFSNVGGVDNDRAVVPEGKYKLFDGFFTGAGYKRSRDGLHLTIECIHWLSGLSFSSSLSESSHPHNPANFSFNAGIPNNCDAAGFGGNLNYTGKTLAQSIITSVSVSQDLWGQGIKPWFLSLANCDRLNVRDLGNNDGINNEAKAALERIDGDKLPMDLADADVELVAQTIATDIAVNVTEPGSNTNHTRAMANVTLWDKLVGDLAPTYMFSLVPQVDKAKVIPFIPGLREIYNPRKEAFTILSRDQVFIDYSARLPRLLRAMGIFGGHGWQAGASFQQNTNILSETIGGMYVAREDGLVQFKQAPRWLAECTQQSTYVMQAAGLKGPKGSAMHPGAGQPADAKQPQQVQQNMRPLLDKMAHALYANEMIKLRAGQVAGPLRFDICPGSNISVEGTKGAFIQGDEPVGEGRIGTVVKVVISADAERSIASTEYKLMHMRTEKENEEDDTSIEQHPLYARKWTGNILTEAE